MMTRTVYYAPDGCTCYRRWNVCPACVAWNEAPTAAWYVDGRPERPGDRCAHGRLVCDRCAHDVGSPVPSQTWGASA